MSNYFYRNLKKNKFKSWSAAEFEAKEKICSFNATEINICCYQWNVHVSACVAYMHNKETVHTRGARATEALALFR